MIFYYCISKNGLIIFVVCIAILQTNFFTLLCIMNTPGGRGDLDRLLYDFAKIYI